MCTGAKHITSLSPFFVSLHYLQTLSANRLYGTSTKVTVTSCPTAAVKRAPSQVPQGSNAAGEDSPDSGAALALMSVTPMSTDSHRDTGTVTVTWQPHNLPSETHHMQLLYTELLCFKPF